MAADQPGWQSVIANLYANLNISILDTEHFFGQIRQSSFSRLDLTRFETDGEVAHRTSSHIGKDEEDFFLLNLGLAGTATFRQFGRECEITQGKYTLLHTGSPYSFVHPDRVSFVCLKIPAGALEARVNEVHDLCALSHPVNGGLAKVTADLLVSLDQEAAAICDASASAIEASLLDMVGVLLTTNIQRDAVGGTAVRWATHRRAMSLMTEAMGDGNLSPDALATRLGISTRYLHRIFEDADDTVSGTLARLRLEKSRQDLADPCQHPLSIKQIAFRNGFKSQSHFASAFRKRFGMTPKDARSVGSGDITR